MNNYVQLAELIKTISKTHIFDKSELVFLNTSDVLEGKILVNHYTPISELKGQAKKTIKNGDILYSEIRPKNKRYAYVKNLQNPEDYVVSTKLMVLRNSSKDLDTDYLYHFLTYEETLNYLQRRAENRIGSFPQITFDVLKTLQIWLPNLRTQKRIAKVLSDLDAKIEVNNKINQELEAMAKTLYGYWFVQFDFSDANGKPYKSSGGKMVFNEEFEREIPQGWKVRYMVDELDVQYGFPFSTKLFNDDKIGNPVIRIRDILENSISLHTTEIVDEKYKLNKGDLLIGMDGNFHMNFWDKNDCYLNQRCVRIRQSIESGVTTIQTLLDTQPYIKAREKNVSRTTVGHLSAGDIKDLKVLIPKEDLRNKANEIFDSTLDKIILNRNENQKLAELRDWLLPMLMNGQVSVGEGYGESVGELGMVAENGVDYKSKN